MPLKKSLCKFYNECRQPLLTLKGTQKMNFKKAVKKHNNKNHSKFNTNFNINQPSSKRHGPHICLRLIFCNIFWLALISNQHFWNHNPTSLQAGFLLIGKEWKNLFKFKRKWKKQQLPKYTIYSSKMKKEKNEERGVISKVPKNLCCFIYHHHKQSKRLTWNPTCFPFPF